MYSSEDVRIMTGNAHIHPIEVQAEMMISSGEIFLSSENSDAENPSTDEAMSTYCLFLQSWLRLWFRLQEACQRILRPKHVHTDLPSAVLSGDLLTDSPTGRRRIWALGVLQPR